MRRFPWFALATAGFTLCVGVFISLAEAHADEGQWMPKQISELDGAMLKKKGLELSADEVWNANDGGLMAAIVNLSGCSAGFVSERGLVATNHHCAHAAIQGLSSVDHDYLTDGFLANTLPEELRAKGRTVKVLQSIEDVTGDVVGAASSTDPTERSREVERATKRLVANCEAEGGGTRCDVQGFYNGSEYQLFRFLEFEDLRLVYAPPSAVGNYGGEVDNWMWPRHTGDFSLLRVYGSPDGKPAAYAEENVPYSPKRWLEVSPDGVTPGDFVAVLGFPGHTDRYLPAAEAERRYDQSLPALVKLYGEWIELLQERGAIDPEIRIKVAATMRGLANRHKNARGMIEGIRRLALLDRRRAEESRLAEWAKGQGEKYATVLEELSELATERRREFGRDFLLSNVSRPSNALAIAIVLVRRASERRKPDLERNEAYMERGEKRLWSRTERRLRDFDPGVDASLLRVWLGHAGELAAGQEITGVTARDLPGMLAASKVTDAAFVKLTFGEADWATIEKSTDPMIAWARDLLPMIEASEAAGRERNGRMLELGPLYFEMLAAVRTGPVYPDANGTLRFSYASVGAYAPRDGLLATPQTTLGGQVAKHTAEKPFDLPKAVLDAAPGAATTYWADPALGDVPVCFLSNADTTGGNSGSPVVDGRGRWVGLNFDRVWENIAGDFGYSQSQSRNISVDVRYLLWTLDRVASAAGLLEEMGVAKYATAPARAPLAPSADAGDTVRGNFGVDPAKYDGPDTPDARSGCGCRSGGGKPFAIAVVLLVLGVRVRRKSR